MGGSTTTEKWTNIKIVTRNDAASAVLFDDAIAELEVVPRGQCGSCQIHLHLLHVPENPNTS